MIGMPELNNPETGKNMAFARRIIDQAIRQITHKVPEFAYALSYFGHKTTDREIKISTDGRSYIYNPNRLVRQFSRNGIRYIEGQLIHVLLHYLRGDLIAYDQAAHTEVLDLCLDAEVHRAMEMLGYAGSVDERITQSPISYYESKYDKTKQAILKLNANKLISDDHSYWIRQGKKNPDNGMSGSEGDGNGQGGNGESDVDTWIKINRITFSDSELSPGMSPQGMQEAFCRLIEGIKEYDPGDRHIGFISETEASKTQTDYRNIIKQLLEENVKEEETEEIFDRAFYCYGLDLYEDVPLIEPGEDENITRDIGRIVIAIDTSGSCYFDLVHDFLGTIVGLINEIAPDLSEDSELIIMECDSKIHHEESLKGNAINTKTFENRELHGGLGTDFVPVFERINELNRKNPLRPVKALIYLSDAKGEFPEEAPDYPAIFVIPESGDEAYEPEIPDYVTVCRYRSDRGGSL